MKKYITNIKTLGALLIAAATTTACSTDDTFNEEQPEKKTYTLTVNATMDDASTRALSVKGEEIVATWEEDDAVEVYEISTKLGTIYAKNISNDGKSCTLTGELDTAPTGTRTSLRLQFRSTTYGNQDGTLEYIAQHCDYAVAEVPVTVNGNNITGIGTAQFENKNAIVKFTLKYKNKEDVWTLTPNKVVVAITTENSDLNEMMTTMGKSFPTYTFNIKPHQYYNEDYYYFAMPTLDGLGAPAPTYPYVPDVASVVDLTFTATDDDNTYTYMKLGYPFEAGKYYDITIYMKKQQQQQQ
jgi:hypothetical protein